LVVERERRRRDVVAAPPELDLLGTVLLHGLSLIEALQRAVVTLVQAPAPLDRQPHEVHLVQHDPRGADSALEDRGEDEVELEPLLLEKPPGFARLITARVGQVDVDPAGKKVLQVPDALSVTEQY